VPKASALSREVPARAGTRSASSSCSAAAGIHTCLSDIGCFSRIILQRSLRDYQLAPARAITASIQAGAGRRFAVMMSRQAGKNELSAQLEAYLLNVYQRRGGQIVKASPTFKPQTVNSMLRLEHHLDNVLNRGQWRRREGYIFELFQARCLFFSAAPAANVVGATASILLACDEAQQVSAAKWRKDFEPMGASTNATTVLFGTAWTSKTLLAETIAELERMQRKDGLRRVFKVDADQVGLELPAYAAYVRQRVAALGRQHPLIRTQYFLEEIDDDTGMFPPQRRALMHGDHERRHEPVAGRRYALLIDVGGEDEQPGVAGDRTLLQNPRRDATALTVVDVEGVYGELPVYRVVDRHLWVGEAHSALHQKLLALVRHWRALWVVVDATGVGAGLSSFLEETLGRGGATGQRIMPVQFSRRVKSDLGWDFLGVVETGRYRDYVPDGTRETRQFWYEVEACQREVRTDPNHTMRWGVWDPVGYDGLIAYGHDDLLISAALCALLDEQTWPGPARGAAVETRDPLEAIDGTGW
jgi:hypothetical protein